MAAQSLVDAQETPLLRTKFFVPPLRRERVSRPRLLERLDAGLALQGALASPAPWQQRLEQKASAVADLLHSFTGSHRFVLDYLVEEVLEQQPEEIQKFLLQTSILLYVRQALAVLPEQDVSWRSMATVALGDAYSIMGDQPSAYQVRREAWEAGKAAGNAYWTTLKAHTRNIYGKLDVHSRVQAVARARAVGVLPST